MRLPFLISIPHCSGRIPEDVKPKLALSEEEILESTDIGTMEIFGEIPAEATLCAEWSRLVVDLNRGTHERGPKGLIATIDYNGRRIYRPGCEPDRAEIERRVQRKYRPYHNRLGELVSSLDIQALFDCHSLSSVGPAEAPDPGINRKDIVLGNNSDLGGRRFQGPGESTCPWKTLFRIREAFEAEGFSVSLNNPYSGGYITTHYGAFMRRKGKIAVQLEINEGLYVDPKGLHPLPEKAGEIRQGILQTFERIAGILS